MCVQNKTLKVGLVNATMALCLPIGTGLSGILYRELGFTGVYIIALILCCISIWMAHIFVHDTKQIKFDSGKKQNRSYWTRIKFFFSLNHIIDAFKVSFKKEKNNRRMKVIALTLLITLIMGPLQGEKGVAYLYTRVKFNWNEVQFSVYSTTTMFINLVGTFVTLGIVVRKFGVDDALIGTVATTGKLLAQFIYVSATSPVVFYSVTKNLDSSGDCELLTRTGHHFHEIDHKQNYSGRGIRWLYMQHRKETKESYKKLPDMDVLKEPNGASTKYGAIKP
ncbi:hippocampus abundant transcript 1 protein-like [Aphis craccivora]|uniref:Hippocampus abundant transcript 1 protein-like n=1 Tax=Aphis craccivora TaxID=307492 RepID=A0A6G0YDZ1_APHCR|nr:hippocampus abundant transcript 1 protein-like [Aphis craccivora]